MWQVLSTGLLLLSVVVVVLLALGSLVMTLLVVARTKEDIRVASWVRRLTHLGVTLVALLAGFAVVALGSQWHASTPLILGANGQPLPGSIATLEPVTLERQPGVDHHPGHKCP